MSLGSNLFHARKSKGLSQEAAAEKLGVSRQTISKWETDETLPENTRGFVWYDAGRAGGI